jgi:hypothetical protein
LDEGAHRFVFTAPRGCEHIIIAQSSIDEFDDAVGPNRRTFKEACDLLVNCTLFAGLSPDERAAVVAPARIRTLDAGETVFAIGSPGDQMMALLSGWR